MVSAEAAAIHGAVAACRCYGDRTISVGSSCERLCPLMSLVWAGWGSDFFGVPRRDRSPDREA